MGMDPPRIARLLGVTDTTIRRWLARPVPVLEPAPGWMEDALCHEVDADLFYETRRGRHSREAIQVCQLCRVKDECLEWAIAHDEHYGVWGGRTPMQRDEIRRQRRKGVAS